MQLFSADATMFFKKLKKYFLTLKTQEKPPSKVAHNRHSFFFVLPTGLKPVSWKNRPQKLLIIGPHFFCIGNRPITSPNLIFCFIKKSPCLYNDFGLHSNKNFQDM